MAMEKRATERPTFFCLRQHNRELGPEDPFRSAVWTDGVVVAGELDLKGHGGEDKSLHHQRPEGDGPAVTAPREVEQDVWSRSHCPTLRKIEIGKVLDVQEVDAWPSAVAGHRHDVSGESADHPGTRRHQHHGRPAQPELLRGDGRVRGRGQIDHRSHAPDDRPRILGRDEHLELNVTHARSPIGRTDRLAIKGENGSEDEVHLREETQRQDRLDLEEALHSAAR